MAVIGKRVTVASSPTLIATADGDGGSVTLRNADASNAIDIGSSSVATGAGFSLIAGAAVSIDLDGSDRVYGVTSSGSVVVHVVANKGTT
jgi:hypothetical protein